MIPHLEPDILECEIKWALGSITTNKASGGDGIQVKLFQMLKDDAVESATVNMQANLEKAAATGLEKVSFHSNLQKKKKGKTRECSNYCTISFISHDCKVMLKILQARLQQYATRELSNVPAEFQKGRGPRDQIANIHSIIKKTKEVPEKNLLLLY